MLSPFFVALSGFLVINALLLPFLPQGSQRLTASSIQNSDLSDPMYGTWTWWMARGFVADEPAPIAVLGSSQMNAPAWAADATLLQRGVDCLLHRQILTLGQEIERCLGAERRLAVANCAVQGGMASDYYMIERCLLRDERCPRLVVIGVSPRDFIDNKLPCASSTEVFRYFSRFVDPGELAALAYTDPLGRLFGWLEWNLNELPLRRLNAVVQSRLSDGNGELQNRRGINRPNNELLSAIYNDQQKVRVGQLVVPANMSPVFVDNSCEYTGRYRNPSPPSLPIQYAFFDQLLADLHDKGIAVLVVGMPTTKRNRTLLPAAFWTSYENRLQQMCSAKGASFVDLSGSVDFLQADYVDTVHLNDKGGRKLFVKIAELIASDQRLATTLANRGTRIAGNATVK